MLPLLILAHACAPYPEGLRATPAGTGPTVRIDWDAKPLPDVPFPNDLATTVDRHSPTGLRLNVPLAASTEMERHAREKLNMLTGFGIYSPIAVPFEAPLDLDLIARLHRDDDKLGVAQFTDDAFFLIDVTPGSPTYLEPVALDVGAGRFPIDVARTDRYFPNDSRSGEPSLVFDTFDEDLNGNGKLDWGEDTDNDGVLDIPNVYPEGGDHREDLLAFYEKQTDTLVFRPVVPLREKTTYAVVLTERLLGEDGEPVRSPWKFIHHMRQMEALTPLKEAMPGLGLTLDDVAFAWTYTTGDVTGDMVAARAGMKGEGKLKKIDTDVPEGVNEALPVHEIEGLDPTRLPIPILVDTLNNLGLFSDASAEALYDNYSAFGSVVVGGSFNTPNFMGDTDHAPGAWPAVDDTDDFWKVDGFNGTYELRKERVPFTCVLPKGVPQPAPVVNFGHGYGSSRFDFLGFAWAFNRMGFAACAFDYPGHGPTVDPDDLEVISAVLTSTGLVPFLTHLDDSRFRDVDNDGDKDSGYDQWTADAFHTRDMVRQGAVDHAQFIDSVEACGTGTMTTPDGGTAVSCDWDGDGTPDMGGPDSKFYVIGGSLGGINSAVAAAISEQVGAWAPVVPGGGLLDIAFRTEIGGAVEAMHGRLMSPLFVGTTNEAGALEIQQVVNSYTDMEPLTIATITDFPAGGRVVVTNNANGEVREGYIPLDGSFRLALPCDAASAWEKRHMAGIPDSGPIEGATYTIDDPTEAGDPLTVRLETVDGTVTHTFKTWESSVTFQGVTYPAGSRLVAAAEGMGRIRSSPELRRIGFVFSAILEPGDAISYARTYTEEPLEGLDGGFRNVLIMPTPGDSIVNINTGIALARAAGWIDDTVIDDRYGMSVDRWLIDRKVVQGLEEHGPYVCANGNPCLFDADDLDDGTDETGATSDAPLRVTVGEQGVAISALRMPYASMTGSHGFVTPRPDDAFDVPTFATMQMASYFFHDGKELSDDHCLEDASCSWIPQMPDGGDEGGGTGGDDGGTGGDGGGTGADGGGTGADGGGSGADGGGTGGDDGGTGGGTGGDDGGTGGGR